LTPHPKALYQAVAPPLSALERAMPAKNCYYITTPIYYVNDAPHIGHAYTTLACDVLARFMRLDGFEVRLLTGTDEHGQKVEKAARTAGEEPKVFTDRVSQNFRDLAVELNISNDDFIRTTEARHTVSCQAIWKKLEAAGQIYLGSYAGWYAVRDEAFYDESELTPGPAGKRLAPTGAEVEWVEEPSYFFKLSEWGPKLLKHYEAKPEAIGPDSRRNEVLSFLRSGLRDLSVSRTTFRWGVPVPGNPDHIMYVWLDALTNYITAVGYPDTASANYRKFWPASLHMVGKDILRFHAVYWPAFLMAAGEAPPDRVFAHGWWTNEGQKISKSLGNVIEPKALIREFGLDPVRYFLMREVPFGNDGDFSRRAMINRVNGDLANDLGNLAQRVLTQVHRNCGAAVPAPGDLEAADRAFLGLTDGLAATVRGHLARQSFHEALDAIWVGVREANGYVDRQAPWKLAKTDRARMGTVLYALVEQIRRIAILLQPFMPDSMGRILDQLAVAKHARTFASLPQAIAPGVALPAPQPIFPRYVEAGGPGDAGR
jgi:methionyl-tRNA synthetase